jgi:2'-hydroxyisoflavone reductase
MNSKRRKIWRGKMNILVLGGTKFVGKHIVAEALRRGHKVTIFNRGSTNKELFSEVEKLTGNRDGDLHALLGRKWDAVIDTCGYTPRIVRASAQLLAESCSYYTFISSISVYADFSQTNIDETAQVGTLDNETTEEVNGETYGPLKALCEKEVLKAFPEGSLILRPGLIVGPDDYTDRFTYWPVRISRGGVVLAPGNPDAYVQFIDVRDLARFAVSLIERRQKGIYNVTGPLQPLTMEQFLEECKRVLKSDATFTWVDEKFLSEKEVAYWTELPLFIPKSANMKGFSAINITKAMGEGLTIRPLSETIMDTLRWHETRNISEEQWQAGLKPTKEKEVLAAWFEKQ